MKRALLSTITVAVLVAAACGGDEDEGAAGAQRFCDSLATVERALGDVADLDTNSSTQDVAAARDAVQDAYHDISDGAIAIENDDDPQTVDIDAIGAGIEDLIEALTEVADGEPLANQLDAIDALSADIAAEADRLAEGASCD